MKLTKGKLYRCIKNFDVQLYTLSFKQSRRLTNKTVFMLLGYRSVDDF